MGTESERQSHQDLQTVWTVWVGERRFGQSNGKVDLPCPKEQAGGEEVRDGGPVGHPSEVADRQVEV